MRKITIQGQEDIVQGATSLGGEGERDLCEPAKEQ